MVALFLCLSRAYSPVKTFQGSNDIKTCRGQLKGYLASSIQGDITEKENAFTAKHKSSIEFRMSAFI
jgi:hypothetical protein